MLNLDDWSHKEFSYGTPPEDADQDMVDCFCGTPFHPADTGYDDHCSDACYADYIEGLESSVVECCNCAEPTGEPLYSMSFPFCGATCRDEGERLILGVYEKIDEIDGMLLTEI